MPVLKEGSSGPDVTALQQKLKDLGFDPNGVDGTFGPGTKTALIAFQNSKGLEADGKAGPDTLGALQLGGSTSSDAGAGTATATAPAASGGSFHFEGNKAVAPDGTVFGKKFKLGIFNEGSTSIAAFVQANQGAFPNLSASRLRVMSAVSVNEGKLEAINTWDNAFLTFGCFQWTVGADNGAGELPAMVNKFKQDHPASFDQLLGQIGLDVASVSNPPGQPPTGFFSLNGAVVKSASDKGQKLRTLEMAFRFFRAGQDSAMRQSEIEYAASRIDLFYRNATKKINGLFVGDFVSSEFGVALILDQHVNRPGHVPKTLAEAVNQFISSTGKTDPTTWTDQDEASLLNIYIQRRNSTSMTDSQKRADRVRQAVNNGLASDKRGSFQP